MTHVMTPAELRRWQAKVNAKRLARYAVVFVAGALFGAGGLILFVLAVV